jgi:hypothetical protein
MTATVMPLPLQQFDDEFGAPLVGGMLFSYAAGSAGATPQAVYTDVLLTIPYPNPIILDAAGTAGGAIYLQPLNYQFILRDAAGNVIFNADNIVAVGSATP